LQSPDRANGPALSFSFAPAALLANGHDVTAFSSSIADPTPVLLFDGECGLCQRVVRLLLRIDRAGRLRFAPLQGVAAQAFLRGRGLPTKDFDTIVYVWDWPAWQRSDFLVRTDGAIAALRATGSKRGRVFAGVLKIFPRPFRDAGYRAIGHWRYRFFGPWHPQPLARPEWADRFLA
jgi:predicted DCC family thiol-disulfide oxidoreductase YuxK